MGKTSSLGAVSVNSVIELNLGGSDLFPTDLSSEVHDDFRLRPIVLERSNGICFLAC